MKMSELAGKRLAILGGTGTLGCAVTRLILAEYSDVSRITIYSRDEVKQLEMIERVPSEHYPFMDFKLGDVRDLDRLTEVLKEADFVIHAAALKHVVMAEKNPSECWKTNVEGTRNVINACKKNKVEKCILISTDKAENPIGVYGRSKKEAEDLFLKGDGESNTKFYVVRLGNIVDARGSVYEVFKRQKKAGVLKVTHPEATRFYISQKEAARFTVNTLLKGTESNTYYPEMNSIKILDLAKSIAPECDIEFTGLRPGDKLHEEIGGVSSEIID